MVQSKKLGTKFSTSLVAFLWLLLIGTTGIYNITSYPVIFRACDPSRAVLCQSPGLYCIHLADRVLQGSFEPSNTMHSLVYSLR